VTDTLADIIRANSPGIVLPTSARRQVVPYDDMQALDPPVDLPQIGTDLLTTLAVLAAQGPDKPRLMSADTNGALIVNSQINQVTTFIAPFTGGQLTAQVKDTTGFAPGTRVTMISQSFGGAVCTAITVTSVIAPHTLNFFATCTGQNFVVGDYVIGHPRTDVETVINPVRLGGDQVNTAIGVVGTPTDNVMITTTVKGHRRLATDDIRSWDGGGTIAIPNGGTASITLPALGAGFMWVLAFASVFFFNGGAAGTGPTIRIWDGLSGVGTLKYQEAVWVLAGQTATIKLDTLRIRGSDNNPIVVDTSPAVANVNGQVSAYGYVEG
jgi:hypothetical protein